MTTQRTQRAEGAVQWPTVVWLTVVWCLLWGELSVGNILAGVVVALVVVRVFPLPPLAFASRPHPWALTKLVAIFLKDVVVSSVEVAVVALRFGYQPTNAVIVVPLRTRSEFALFLTAEMVSLVPGSLLIDASRSEWSLQVHIIDARTRDDVEEARQHVWQQERRVVEALGSAEDIGRVRGDVR